MKIACVTYLLLVSFLLQAKEKRNIHYITNQAPLVAQPYTALPLGAIQADGFLLEMLKTQRDGLTGHLDSIYSLVCGPDNGWLGGSGDGWERGPYWLDGLVPLAYLLDDAELKEKAQLWIEWSIQNQREDGYFGPKPLPEGYSKIPGTQQGMRNDWWPKMVMLKVLQQYYMATQDTRIIELMTRYFRYQLKMLPDNELGFVTYWGNRRGGDNLAIVYWLYNVTGDKFLLDLAEIIHVQTFDWTTVYSGNMIRRLNPLPGLHCVNVAQGLKEPLVYYQQHPEDKYLEAVKKGLSALRDCHGFVNGMYGADEFLHGNNPTQGSELCSAVEMMYSFETAVPITGDVYYADYLEKIAYNVLPTQSTDDYTRKQYFQQANQIKISDEARNFFHDDHGRLVYGTTTGYPCCLSNMHQGWPKFIQNTWYATADNGIAALVYGPTKVTARVAGGEEISITETTDYPFRENIKFTIQSEKDLEFPFHLRIPGWCKSHQITINGEIQISDTTSHIAVLNRRWKSGDVIELHLAMDFRFSKWHENSLGIERGPLVYALRISEEWSEITKEGYDDTFWEVKPKSPWNYAILNQAIVEGNFKLDLRESLASNPWNLENAPVRVITKGIRLPEWREEKGSAGAIPVRTRPTGNRQEEEIVLIPYGCTTLRISQFPVIY